MKLEQTIETPRLRLRSYRSEDRDFCLALWGDAENGRYMADPLRENADEKYLACFADMEDDPEGYYLIAELKDGGAPVGTFCLFPKDGNVDIGYCLAKARWRQGLGSEMLEAAIRWTRARGGISLSGEVADDNEASLALLRKFGFTAGKAGRFKKWNEERWFDSHIMELRLDGGGL